MALNFGTKGRFRELKDILAPLGYKREHDGVHLFKVGTEVAIQAAIDAYDPIPDLKKAKINELKEEGLSRANLVYDTDDNVFPNVAAIKLLLDIENTYDRSAPPAPRLIAVNQILTAFDLAKTAINSMTIIADIENYDVVNTPSWP